MLQPLATLQAHRRLVKTRATKDKEGMIHSTTFEVNAKLCMVACAYSDKNIEDLSLPFLTIHLNHSTQQDIDIMNYQKRCKAGEYNDIDIQGVQRRIQCAIHQLQNVSIINPYATIIDLPEFIPHPRKSLLLLLNFIEVITYFFQYQRASYTHPSTGEVFIKSHPQDVELAITLLKSNLLRRADELSTSARGFYNWLHKFLAQNNQNEFSCIDIRKVKSIHPRTLNRYLQELKLFSYIQIKGGNKHREGYTYILTEITQQSSIEIQIEQSLQNTIQKVWQAFHDEQEQIQKDKHQANMQKVKQITKAVKKRMNEIKQEQQSNSIAQNQNSVGQ
jgi:hypothetical protein